MSKVIVTTETELQELIKESLRKVLIELEFTKSDSSDDILNVDQASQYLHLAKQTLYGLTSRYEIPFYKRGKKLYFKKSVLEDWINQGRRTTVSEMESLFENK